MTTLRVYLSLLWDELIRISIEAVFRAFAGLTWGLGFWFALKLWLVF